VFDQKFDPSLVAIAREQRVVEIEKGEDVGGQGRERGRYNPRVETGLIVHGPAILARLGPLLAAPRGRNLPLRIGHDIVGWVDEDRAGVLARFADVFDRRASGLDFKASLATAAARTMALDRVVEVLAAEGRLTAWRDERYAIATHFGGAPLCLIERAAARFFGILTFAAHVNGLVRGRSTSMWFARRSADKAIDPGLLDNLVGGGIPAGATVAETMVGEAWEEAGIPAAVAAAATPAGEVRICRAQPDGLQRETIFVHDLWLDRDFAPSNQDGEAVEHRLVSLDGAAALIANDSGPDVVTADASLVILDFLLRQGAIDSESPDARALGALRYPPLELAIPESDRARR
jgi:8-oxo-dGTP pyrophosphatase MutT (NUDIX family)